MGYALHTLEEGDFFQNIVKLKKGSLAGVDGRIQTRSYDNQEGRKVFVTEVVAESVQFLEPKGSGNMQSGQSQGQNQSNRQPVGAGVGNGQNQNQNQGNQQHNDNPFAGGLPPISDDPF